MDRHFEVFAMGGMRVEKGRGRNSTVLNVSCLIFQLDEHLVVSLAFATLRFFVVAMCGFVSLSL